MGTDIHQKIFVRDIKSNKYIDLNEIDKNFEFEDLVCYRYYRIFGVLAGVRSYEFEIMNKNKNMSEDFGEEFRNKYAEYYHSLTWYFFKDLKVELRKTTTKIKNYMKRQCAKDQDYINDGYIEEDIGLLKDVKEIIKKLDEYKNIWKKKYQDSFDIDSMKIVFYFDS